MIGSILGALEAVCAAPGVNWRALVRSVRIAD